MDWKKVRLEPGFSVWKLAVDTHSETSGFMKGFDQTFTTEDILKVTNTLLEGKTPS